MKNITIAGRELDLGASGKIDVRFHPSTDVDAADAVRSIAAFAGDWDPKWHGNGTSAWATQTVELGEAGEDERTIEVIIFFPRTVTQLPFPVSDAQNRAEAFASNALAQEG